MPVEPSKCAAKSVGVIDVLLGRGGAPTILSLQQVAQSAGDTAVRGARPLHQNSFKIPLMRNLVRRAVREAAASA